MRLDVELVRRGLARSRHQASELIRSGRVSCDGDVVTRPAKRVFEHTRIEATSDGYVSRGAHKLIGALTDSETAVPARCLDAGASTGGFTQVLLSRGASRVYAVDVGHDQLAESLRADSRVVNLEGKNLRSLTIADTEAKPVDLAVADVSFISLKLILGPILSVVSRFGTALVLVKPQFEVGRERLGGHGVVRDPVLRAEAVESVLVAAKDLGWSCVWQGVSQLPGPNGNLEFFCKLQRSKV